jgi:hypothetical protein
MSKYRVAIALSMTALAVAVLGQTSIGHAAVGAVRVAVFAENAGRVNNIQASRKPMPGRLVPLNARGKLPSSVLPNRSTPGGYTHTLIVSPNPDPVQAGRVLREVVSGITDPSASNPYLVKIEPGIYDLETDSLFMRPYVDIEGSGEGITTITSAIATGSGTVVGANNSELRYLTVKNTGEANQQVVAIFTETTSPRFSHVTAIASGGSENYGIHTSNGTIVLSHVTSSASGGGQSFGVANYNSVMTVLSSTFSAADAANFNAGFVTTYGGSNKVNSSTITASGGAIAIGMRAYNGSHTLTDTTVSATGSGQSTGVYIGQKSSTPTMNILQSRVSGQTNSVYSIGGPLKVGASQLTGPAGTFDIGTMICVASFDGAYNPLGSGCT